MDLKNFKAPSRRWRYIAWTALGVAFVSVVGPMDFAYQIELEADNKLMKVEMARLKKPQAQVQPRIYARKCAWGPYVATQADGGKWKIGCTPSADLKGVKL